MQYIVYSLWGAATSPYYQGLLENIKLIPIVYPNWTPLVFVSDELFDKLRSELICSNLFAELIPVSLPANWTGMFWRMLPILWSNAEYVCVRDCDSLVSERESAAVEEWIKSGKTLHIMRDHPGHAMPIMGGMFGVRCKQGRQAFANLKRALLQLMLQDEGDYWQVDQQYLASIIFPKLKNDCHIHDPFFMDKDFPVKRSGLEYIGRPYNREDVACQAMDMTSSCNSLKLCMEFIENRKRVLKFHSLS